MTLILVMFAVAIACPSFAVGLLLGRWEARQGLALICEPAGWRRGRLAVSTDRLTARQERLANALLDASHAARVAGQDADDGGSANMDAPFLQARRGLTNAAVEAAAQAAGVSVLRSNGRWWNGWFVNVVSGQGARRTRMAEAAYRALRNAGEEASVYYQLD